MLHILHGDDITATRKRLSELSSEFDSVVNLVGDKTNFSEIVQALSITDLFVTKKCFVIEQISKLPKSDLEKVLPVFEKVAEKKETNLILWQGSEMTKLQIAKYKKATVESFMLPKLFFTFLDNFTPKNAKSELNTLQQMKNIDDIQIFYALIKRIRQLLMMQVNAKSEEISKMNPWQLNKLKVQSAKFKIYELEKIYKDLFELEKGLKSGGLMLPLKNHLDMLLVSTLH